MKRIDPKTIDAVFDGVELPDNAELIEQTRRFKIAKKHTGKTLSPSHLQNVKKANKKRGATLSAAQRLHAGKKQKEVWQKMTPEQYQARCEKAKEVWKDDEYRERMLKYYHSPEYKKYIKKRNKKVANTPKMRKWYLEFNRAKLTDPKYLKNHAEGVQKRSTENTQWIRKNCRPVWSREFGVYQKLVDLRTVYIKKYQKHPVYAGRLLRNWLKDPTNKDFKYITWPEYDNWSEALSQKKR